MGCYGRAAVVIQTINSYLSIGMAAPGNLNFSADSLRKNSSRCMIKKEVLEIYKAIKFHILAEHAKGKSATIYDLPSTFAVEAMELKDIQIVVYSELIEMLIGDAFEVKIVLEPTASRLKIAWPSSLEDDERRQRNALITRHLERPSRQDNRPRRAP